MRSTQVENVFKNLYKQPISYKDGGKKTGTQDNCPNTWFQGEKSHKPGQECVDSTDDLKKKIKTWKELTLLGAMYSYHTYYVQH